MRREGPRGGPAARIGAEQKAEVLRQVAAGALLIDAAAHVGYTPRTIRREAQRDREFYDALVSAVATGAPLRRRGQLVPAPVAEGEAAAGAGQAASW